VGEPTAPTWLSVVVPAFNEAPAIGHTIDALVDALERGGRPWEIIVVDNASTDATRELVAQRASSRVRLLANDRDRGKGFSVRRGMLAAGGELRLHCDTDCAGCLVDLPRMVELIAEHDVVVGSRLASGARVGRRQTIRRRIAGRSFIALCRTALREPTRDLFCGFKLWRGEAALQTYERTQIDGWVSDAEALAMARALGYRVVETGIAWSDRPGSRLSMARVLVPVLKELSMARRNVSRARTEARAPTVASAAPSLPVDQRP
jgi:dolichyl-phosphate beta-glucosyltransferase